MLLSLITKVMDFLDSDCSKLHTARCITVDAIGYCARVPDGVLETNWGVTIDFGVLQGAIGTRLIQCLACGRQAPPAEG